jgi:hypothetical protein
MFCTGKEKKSTEMLYFAYQSYRIFRIGFPGLSTTVPVHSRVLVRRIAQPTLSLSADNNNNNKIILY